MAETCQNGVCSAGGVGYSEDHLDCESTSLCLNNQCEAIRLDSCGDAEQCIGQEQCSTIDACGARPSCYGTLGASCESNCQCTGRLICADSSTSCIECLHGGQCDATEICGENGLCTQEVDVGLAPTARNSTA